MEHTTHVLNVFISHNWAADSYAQAVQLLNDAAGSGWRNVSITRDSAIQLATDARLATSDTVALLDRRLDVLNRTLEALRSKEGPTAEPARHRHEQCQARARVTRGTRERVEEAIRSAKQDFDAAKTTYEALADLSHLVGRRLELLEKSRTRLKTLAALRAGYREREAEQRWLSSLMAWDDSPETLQAARVAYCAAESALAEPMSHLNSAKAEDQAALEALAAATHLLEDATKESRPVTYEISNLERRIQEQRAVLNELRAVQYAPGSLDLRRILPQSGGKLSMHWLRGSDVVTANLALAIHERIAECDVVVLALSDDFVWRQWLEFEFRAAADCLKPVVALEGAPMPVDFKYYAVRSSADALSLRKALEDATARNAPVAAPYRDRFTDSGDSHQWMLNLRQRISSVD